MFSLDIKIQITSFLENIKKLKQKLKSNYKISLFLIKRFSFINKLLIIKNKETKFFKFDWQILKTYLQKDEKLIKIRLKVKSKRSEKNFDLKFLIYEKTEEFLMVISNFSTSKQKKIHQFLESFYPKISRFYLIHKELFQIAKEIEKKFQYELFSRWYIISEKFGRHVDKDIKYRKGIYYEECFINARKDNKFVEKIRLDNLDTYRNYNNGKPYDFKISREGELSLLKGAFDDFYIFIIERILEYANIKYQILKDRSRINNKDKEINPIIIQFFSTPFKDKQGIEIFLNELKKYPNCSYAIIHEGNPYLEMIFVDYSDNSSFSIETFTNRSIVLFPQLHASESALFKLFSFITKKFSDGELYDYEDYKKSMIVNIKEK